MYRLLIPLLALLWSTVAVATETPSSGLIEIRASQQTHTLNVEIADEPEERSRGLMYRTALAEGAGMLFLYPSPRRTSFWMKNTPLPLDLLFIDPYGRIVKIVSGAEPFSLKPIPSEHRVIAVLEIDAGASSHLGIKVGDRARWVNFPPRR